MANLDPRPRKYLGEPDKEYRERLSDWEKRQEQEKQQEINGRAMADVQRDRDRFEVQRRAEELAFRKRAAKPLPGEIVELNLTIQPPRMLVVFKPRVVAPSDCDQAQLLLHNVYIRCAENEAQVTIAPDEFGYNRFHQYLKRLPVGEVTIGMVGFLAPVFYHPAGYAAPEAWILIVDPAAKPNVDGTTGPSIRGTVSGVRGDNDGGLMHEVMCDSGPCDVIPSGRVLILTTLDGMLDVGTKGSLRLVGENWEFIPDPK